MGRKVSDRRGKSITGEKQKNDDYYRIRIVMYLLSNNQANRNQMLLNKSFGINRIERGRLTNLLQKMTQDEWIKKIEIEGTHYPLFKLNEKGLQVGRHIQKLRSEEPSNFLFDLEDFAGVKRLGLDA